MDRVESTQDEAGKRLRGEIPGVSPRLILTHEQTAGRGRFGREWVGERGSSLAMSFILLEHSGHPRPWVLGMAAACAVAGVLHCRVRWPNDLFLEGKKLGGILTEIMRDKDANEVPVLGIGVNLNQTSFPAALAETATSLAIQRPGDYDAIEIAMRIVEAFNRMPEPEDFAALAAIWMMFDETPGKKFKLPEGDEAVAIGIGPHGELICSVKGESRAIYAAEAILDRAEMPTPTVS